MFGIKYLQASIDAVGKIQDQHTKSLEKIHFTLAELNDNINLLIDRLDEKKPDKPKKEKKK